MNLGICYQKRIAEDPNADPEEDYDFYFPENEDWAPTARQFKDIAHDNLGHPSNRDFARMIKVGNGRPEIARWVAKHFRCDGCQAVKHIRSQRPSDHLLCHELIALIMWLD